MFGFWLLGVGFWSSWFAVFGFSVLVWGVSYVVYGGWLLVCWPFVCVVVALRFVVVVFVCFGFCLLYANNNHKCNKVAPADSVGGMNNNDMFDNTKFSHVPERFGGLKGVEVQHAVDNADRQPPEVDLPLVADGVWMFRRHSLNDRGDEGTVRERQASVEEVGIVDGIRGGAWVVPTEDVRNIWVSGAALGQLD